MNETNSTQIPDTQHTVPEKGQQVITELNMDDLKVMKNVVELAVKSGIIHPKSMALVGNLYNKLELYV